MSDTSPHRDAPHRGSPPRGDARRDPDRGGPGRGNPRRVATWARALAAAVLLDPSALPGPRSHTATEATTATRRVGTSAPAVHPPTDPDHAGDPTADPASGSVPATSSAAARRDVPTVLAVIDAAAGLIEAGDEGSALLLLGLTEPAPDRPAAARDALRLLTSIRPPAAACAPPSPRSPGRPLRGRGPRGGRAWGGPA